VHGIQSTRARLSFSSLAFKILIDQLTKYHGCGGGEGLSRAYFIIEIVAEDF
jgi:hypothetical protein